MGCSSSSNNKHDFVVINRDRGNGINQTNVATIEEFRKAAKGNISGAHTRSPSFLEKLVAKDIVSTQLNKTELAAIISIFRSNMTKDNLMTLKEFRNVFIIENDEIAQHTYNMFDTNKSGDIDIHEFINGYSKWKESLDNTGDRQLLAFNMFDIKEAGMLSKEDFKSMLTATMDVSEFDLPFITTKATRELAEAFFKAAGEAAPYTEDIVVDYRKLISIFKAATWSKKMLNFSADDVESVFMVESEKSETNYNINIDEFVKILICAQANKLLPEIDKVLSLYTDTVFQDISKDGKFVYFQEFKEWIDKNPKIINYVSAIANINKKEPVDIKDVEKDQLPSSTSAAKRRSSLPNIEMEHKPSMGTVSSLQAAARNSHRSASVTSLPASTNLSTAPKRRSSLTPSIISKSAGENIDPGEVSLELLNLKSGEGVIKLKFDEKTFVPISSSSPIAASSRALRIKNLQIEGANIWESSTAPTPRMLSARGVKKHFQGTESESVESLNGSTLSPITEKDV